MRTHHMNAAGKLFACMGLAVFLSGCAEVVSGDAQTVRVDTGDLGKFAPGTREWLSWWQAREHCAHHARSPEIVDLRGSVAVYKCVADK